MPFKRILAYQDDSADCPHWTRIAAAFAERHGASLTGLHVVEAMVGRNFIDADISTALRVSQGKVTNDRDERIKQTFVRALHGFPVEHHWRLIAGDPAAVARRATRFFDLAFIGQSNGTDDDLNGGRRVLEHIVLGSGRPVIIVPHGWTTPIAPKRIVLAWDGSREAVRAMVDAHPLLAAAEDVSVVTILSDEDRRPMTDNTARELTALLSEHGIKGAPRVVPETGRRPGRVLLDFAREAEAELIVLGAYGHSRFREIVLGGVTRHVLNHMAVPVLMSH